MIKMKNRNKFELEIKIETGIKMNIEIIFSRQLFPIVFCLFSLIMFNQDNTKKYCIILFIFPHSTYCTILSVLTTDATQLFYV